MANVMLRQCNSTGKALCCGGIGELLQRGRAEINDLNGNSIPSEEQCVAAVTATKVDEPAHPDGAEHFQRILCRLGRLLAVKVRMGGVCLLPVCPLRRREACFR